MKFNEVSAKTVAEIIRNAKLLQFMLSEAETYEAEGETQSESGLADSALAEIETMCRAISESAQARNNQLADLSVSSLLDKAEVLSLLASQWEKSGIHDDAFKQIGDLADSIRVAAGVLAIAIKES